MGLSSRTRLAVGALIYGAAVISSLLAAVDGSTVHWVFTVACAVSGVLGGAQFARSSGGHRRGPAVRAD